MFLKKKNVQVSSPGRATPVRKYKRGGGGTFSSPKTLPPHFKNPQAHGNYKNNSPQVSIVEFLLPFLRFNSLPTSKCNFPWLFGSPLMCFGALVAHFLQNS